MLLFSFLVALVVKVPNTNKLHPNFLEDMKDIVPEIIKKRLLALFCYIGVAANCMLFFIKDDLYLWGGLLFIIANVSFGASIVFYNSFLPDIASAEDRDRVSSIGWAIGYLGGGLLLALKTNASALPPCLWCNSNNFAASLATSCQQAASSHSTGQRASNSAT